MLATISYLETSRRQIGSAKSGNSFLSSKDPHKIMVWKVAIQPNDFQLKICTKWSRENVLNLMLQCRHCVWLLLRFPISAFFNCKLMFFSILCAYGSFFDRLISSWSFAETNCGSNWSQGPWSCSRAWFCCCCPSKLFYLFLSVWSSWFKDGTFTECYWFEKEDQNFTFFLPCAFCVDPLSILLSCALRTLFRVLSWLFCSINITCSFQLNLLFNVYMKYSFTI